LNKRRIVISQIILSVMAVIVFACDTEKVVPEKSGWGLDYFPLEGNSYRIYDVCIIDYSILGEIDSVSYLLKEVVSDSFLNLNNEYAFVLSRYKKDTPESDWKLDSVWTATKNEEKVVVTENNVPFVKLVFPVQENKQWDGNRMNILEEEKYKMGKIGSGFHLSSINYPATVTVTQMDNPDTILVRDKRLEIYGKNIGLIFKEKIQIKYCSELACIGEGIISSGNKYRQELLQYGKE
jgi:hypothetical protein